MKRRSGIIISVIALSSDLDIDLINNMSTLRA